MYTSLIKYAPFVSSKGEIGMTPISSKPGDEAWSLFGCDKGLVLRPGGNCHEVVGEGYLEGYVRGEMLEELSGDVDVGEKIRGFAIQQIELR